MAELKRVSFKVAKAIKEAGYPQNVKSTVYYSSNGYLCTDGSCNYVCAVPYAMEVWLWLWREKDNQIHNCTNDTIIRLVDFKPYRTIYLYDNAYGKDPEEAIIAAIEYLVDNKLLK